MNMFIRQITSFTILLIFAIFTFSAVKTNLHKPFSVGENVKTLITGDSHVQCAINDRLLPGIKNISINSEGYIYSYYKLKEILAHNPQIKKIIVGFSYHNLSSYYDDYISGKHAQPIMLRYFGLLDYSGLFQIIFSNSLLVMPALNEILSTGNKDYPYIGRFSAIASKNRKYNETTMMKRVKGQYYVNHEIRRVSKFNSEYIAKIVELSRKHNVKLTLINTPLHKNYLNEIPLKYKDEYKEILKKFNLPVIDFLDLNLSDDHFLPDGDHLNSKGALLATKYFAEKWYN
jgi:hypothetical protein